jgi:hypothetical protein
MASVTVASVHRRLREDESEERRRPHRGPIGWVGDGEHGPRIRADPGYATRAPATGDGSVTGSCGAEDKSVSPRTARVGRDVDGNLLGSAVFLDSDDLRELVDGLDGADHVAYRVVDGDLVLDVDADGDDGGKR